MSAPGQLLGTPHQLGPLCSAHSDCPGLRERGRRIQMIHAECGNAHLQEPPWGRAPGGLPSQWLWPSGMCRLCKAPFVPEGLEHDFRNKMTLKLRRKRRKKRIGDNINVTVRQPQDPTTATQETSRDLGALPSKGCHQVGTQGQPVACWLLGLYFSHSGRW